MSDPAPQGNGNLPAILTAVSAALVGLFTAAQIVLLGKFAVLIARYGVGDLLLTQLRKASRDVVVQLDAAVPALVEQVVSSASADGAAAGGAAPPVGGLRPFGLAGDTFESHAERSARAIREDLAGKLNQLGYPITRFADDVYRTVVADAATGQVLGTTPFLAQRSAYEKLVRNGIDGFTDSRGRKWELSAYVEMAVRTAAQRAFNVSHLDRMMSLGIELFTVTDDGHPCPLCAPWEGQILSAVPDVRASATIADATAAGLFHPRCRHTLVAFTPGVSPVPVPHVWTEADQQRYDDTQHQRAIERSIRAAKREQAAAYTPAMRSRAAQDVRVAQKAMRDFLDRTGMVRRSSREQINHGF